MTHVFRSFSILWFVAAAVSAQNVLFEEGFDQGMPRTWTHLRSGVGSDVWRPGTHPVTGDPDMHHEYFCTNGTLFRDNRLITPSLDLRGLRSATLEFDDDQVLPTWRLLNAVEVSISGASFTQIASVTRGTSGRARVQVDLTGWLGFGDVRFAFHYQGDIANEWRIDNVRVTTPQPVHAVDGLAAGSTATFSVAGATAGQVVLFAVSLSGAGPLPVPFGDIWLSPPILALGSPPANSAGGATVPVAIPPGSAGALVWSQCLELRSDLSFTTSNLVVRTIR